MTAVVRVGRLLIRQRQRSYALDDLALQITPENRHGETDRGEPEGARGVVSRAEARRPRPVVSPGSTGRGANRYSEPVPPAAVRNGVTKITSSVSERLSTPTL